MKTPVRLLRSSWIVSASALALLLASCAPAAVAPPAGAPAAAPATDSPHSGPLAELLEKAGQEREVILQMTVPSRGSVADASRRMAEGVKEMFGVDIVVTFDHSLSYNAATAKAITEVQSGNPPSYDLMYQTTITAPPLFTEDAMERFDWRQLFEWVDEQDLEYDGQALIVNTQFILPSYNTNLVQAADAPKTWDDLLDPKWKGRIGSTVYQDPWVQMSEPQAWGEEQTLEFVRRLAEQEPILGRYPDLHQKVVSGEIAITAVDFTNRVDISKEQGAPVETALVEPVLVTVNVGVVPKGAPHRHAAALLNAWFLSEEGQRFMDEAYGSTSLYKAGTSAAEFVQGRSYVVPTDFQLEHAIRLQNLYEDIIVKG